VRREAEVGVYVGEDLREVAGLSVIRVVVQQHDWHAGRLQRPQQGREQQRVAAVQVNVAVAVPDVKLDRQPEVGPGPDEEPVQCLLR